jgi:hypothetical protein
MRIDSALNRRAVGLASLVACGEQNVSYGHLGLHVSMLPALKMPMSEALCMPMVRGEKTRRVVLRRGFRRLGAGCCRHGAGGVSR